ncbi:hypothetical protein BJ508DRAFT_418648 [Ascobolus immersus RN42]|uniref:C2H2-domain containing protein second zinc finger domain-containing protein n=1 Tax=Ascobolus immersus RN42 TaxID=1160509 RepID=A0A3N4HKG2_ASCIM|nr:hypothetical protein BJ508DRAFT_418648 [Ascobolus immersus RN42]
MGNDGVTNTLSTDDMGLYDAHGFDSDGLVTGAADDFWTNLDPMELDATNNNLAETVRDVADDELWNALQQELEDATNSATGCSTSRVVDASVQTSEPSSPARSDSSVSPGPSSPRSSAARTRRRLPSDKVYYCPFQGCSRSQAGKGFTNGRRDNLKQHVKGCHMGDDPEVLKEFFEGIGSVGKGRPRK